jgi:rhodanese-related sulfurtransferase
MIETKIDPAKAREYFANKVAFTTGPMEVHQMINHDEDIVIVDVREEEDYDEGHVPGAINLPKNHWNHPEGLREDAKNILYCYSQTCHLAAQAAHEFAGKGYQVVEMEGGFEAWEANDLETEQSAEE